MSVLQLPADLIDAATLSVSELATNGYQHCTNTKAHEPVIPPELWVWAKSLPFRQLVVAVFDTCRESWPDPRHSDPLDEGGRGLGISSAVADEWGAHLSRSRLGAWRVPGKAVWSAFSLPGPWPDSELSADPAETARHVVSLLAARGIERVGQRHKRGVSLVIVPLTHGDSLNVWVEPKTFTFIDTDHTRVWRPLVDLQDVVEHVVRRVEEALDERQ